MGVGRKKIHGLILGEASSGKTTLSIVQYLFDFILLGIVGSGLPSLSV